jgi:hypothetical protein
VAQQSDADAQATPSRTLTFEAVVGPGEGTTVQDAPSHRSMRVTAPVLELELAPTAQHALGPEQATPTRVGPCPGLGEETMVQDAPSQRSMSVPVGVPEVYTIPTAQHSVEDTQVTALRSLACAPLAFGDGTTDQLCVAAEAVIGLTVRSDTMTAMAARTVMAAGRRRARMLTPAL